MLRTGMMAGLLVTAVMLSSCTANAGVSTAQAYPYPYYGYESPYYDPYSGSLEFGYGGWHHDWDHVHWDHAHVDHFARGGFAHGGFGHGFAAHAGGGHR